MSKRKSNPNEVIQEMNDLVTKDDKNNDSESLPDKDRAKLEDVLKEIGVLGVWDLVKPIFLSSGNGKIIKNIDFAVFGRYDIMASMLSPVHSLFYICIFYNAFS